MTTTSPIPAGPATLATPCPSWCNRKHPLEVETDRRMHVGVITTRGVAVGVEQWGEDVRFHLDERDTDRSLTTEDALSLSYALEVAAETVVRTAKGVDR